MSVYAMVAHPVPPASAVDPANVWVERKSEAVYFDPMYCEDKLYVRLQVFKFADLSQSRDPHLAF